MHFRVVRPNASAELAGERGDLRPISTRPRAWAAIALRLLLVQAVAVGVATAAADTNPHCADYDAQRNVYWGDLHVHTSYSMDAYVILDTRLTPRDAYRFARGETRMLPPLDSEGRGTTPVRIARPLDFAAVTDHAESFGGVRLCTDVDSESYESDICKRFRTPLTSRDPGERTNAITGRVRDLASIPLCGPDGMRCRDAGTAAWQEVQAAAAEFDDEAPSCRFTTFVAYEYTATPNLTKIHRNVIFRNEKVIERPITYLDQPSELGLWQELDRQCIEGIDGCDVLAIPHNSNLSNGRLFGINYPEGASLEEQMRQAALRRRMEPVVEMMQTKGESECRDGMWKVLGADEECDFEKVRRRDEVEDCRDRMGWGALGGKGCRSRLDFVRYALLEGLREAQRIGVNPYAFGLIGGTDNHSGTPGPTEEWESISAGRRPPEIFNPGGLAAVWAEENTREAIFDALRRREAYATSGPRISVRFFGGWEYPENLCDSQNFVAQGYTHGVPMGSDLPQRPSNTAPSFAISATRDVGTTEHPGNLLQRIQIVKGWSDADGTFHQQVVDVAGKKTNGARVDEKTCEVSGPGENQLCAVWTDPQFDANQRAVYYARVLENPSCRFTSLQCAAGQPNTSTAACSESESKTTIQERAWTSPIWYSP